MAKKLEALALSVFCQDMAMMLEAGISPEEVVGLLREDAPGGALSSALESMAQSLAADGSFAAAVGQCGAFPGYACQMIDTAIQAGSAQGMCTMDGSLLNLYRQGRITKDTVTRFCLNHDATMRKLKNM